MTESDKESVWMIPAGRRQLFQHVVEEHTLCHAAEELRRLGSVSKQKVETRTIYSSLVILTNRGGMTWRPQ